MSTDTAAPTRQRGAVDLFFGASAVFAVLGGIGIAWNAAQIVWPGLDLGGIIGFGRLRPMALGALVFGWLALGLLGVAMNVVAGDGALWQPRLASAAAALIALSVAVGAVAVAAGASTGSMLFEFPLWVDAFLAVGLVAAAVVVVRSAPRSASHPAQWFAVAGAVLLPLAFISGAVPGFDGMGGALQNAFAVTAVVVLAVPALGLAAAFGSVGGDAATPPTAIGFWSFIFIAAWTAPRLTMFGPTPDWLETIAIVFGLILLAPVAALAAQLVILSRAARQRRLIVGGAAFLALFAVLNLVASFRSPSSVIRFTSWEDVLLLLPLVGAAGSWLLAYASSHSAPTGGRAAGTALTGGVALFVFAGLAGGLQQGLTWVGGVNGAQPTSFGEFFTREATIWSALSAVGLAAAAMGLVLYAAGWLRSSSAAGPAEGAQADAGGSEDQVEPIALSVLVRGAVALFALAAVSVFIIPAIDGPNRTATFAAEAVDFPAGSLAATGRELYVSEGCVYCHTQQVRPIVTDVGLGAVNVPGDYVGQDPALVGNRRIGPDLNHIGSRTDSTRVLLEQLRSPRSGIGGGWQTMPSYSHLSDSDLLALAEYLGALN